MKKVRGYAIYLPNRDPKIIFFKNRKNKLQIPELRMCIRQLKIKEKGNDTGTKKISK